MALICDTGPLLAALDAADPDHEPCARLLLECEEDLVVPALVLAELDYWCARRLPGHAWLVFLDDVLAGVVDASVIALAERLGESRIATLDQRHFRAVRPAHAETLSLLP